MNTLGQSITVTRSIHYEAKLPVRYVQVAGISYASLKENVLIESIDMSGPELSGPYPSGSGMRRSEDNGKIWIHCEAREGEVLMEGDRYMEQEMPDFFLDPDNGWLVRVFCASDKTRGAPPEDPRSQSMFSVRIFLQISKDEGKTWGPQRQLIQKGSQYDEIHWAKGFWRGRNGAAFGDSHMLKLKDGTILMPVCGSKLHENGTIYAPGGGGVTRISVCFFGKWHGEGIDWDMGEPLSLPRKHSDDGADEPSIAVLPDGRLFMIIRARVTRGNPNSKAEFPGLKYHSLSRDGGRTWSEAEPLLYDDGSFPYSPACLGNVFRSEKNGRLYLITNINSEPGDNCDPRTTLYIGEIDMETLRLIKKSLTVIETRTNDQPPDVRFSNFRWYQDRATGDVELFMNPSSPRGRGNGATPDSSFRYTICLPKT